MAEEGYVRSFSASARSEGGLPVEVVTGSGHRIAVDAPPEGSRGAGPAAVEVFLASLASCAAVSVLLHARRLGAEVRRVEGICKIELKVARPRGV